MSYDELFNTYGLIDGQIGVDEDGQYVIVAIDEESASLSVLQENGWIRVHTYYPDGTETETYRK